MSSRTAVPAAAVVLWMTVIAALCVIPYFMLHGNAVTVAAYEAGIGTVPLLMVYVLISVVTPVYIWRHDRASLRVTAHVLPALTIRTLDPRRPSATAVAAPRSSTWAGRPSRPG